ncbi:hypothetical protein EHQ68_17430 [Leptospira congkakensis]|uniref:Uncharacterized protein n=1 Tax=Leptospira congkakensis TaxID=2484932 RepID=A0A4Z1ANP5_9LEPT|nr:hypothetical protein [Leptospira congkakensis]TGL85586.1 hypothetical protein EHQ68_17430 [Leptospira congkakensis]TGL92345.1 hypothetical protein EHQ69_08720 [Leptospira congkakensis]TGM00091.1 hypothetical protein EHQ70_00675 [Leptospira congkakensis]
MSLCHPGIGNVSCGACCGLFNLKLQPKEFKTLLLERTEEFKTTVNFEVRHSFPIFRKNRETKEAHIQKKDDMTYNCPFLGYVDLNNGRIGCMIHPIFTGDPKSQNFSFYGASICQAYDCKNKESFLADHWESLFAEMAKDSVEYSFLSADHIFVTALEKFFQLELLSMEILFQDLRLELMDLFRSRLTTSNEKNFTSFEINYESFSDKNSLDDYFLNEIGEFWIEWRELIRKKNPG